MVSVDVNPHAVWCTKHNSKLNRLNSKVEVVRADLLGAFSAAAAFSIVLFNAPYLPSEKGEDDSWIGRSWAGGAKGREVIDRFLREVPLHLAPRGQVLLMQSTLAGVEETLSKFNEQGLRASVIAEQKLPFFETLTLIKAQR